MAKLTERITTRFQTAQAADPAHTCSLLNGQGDCFSCGTPLSEEERKRITIRNDGPTTTIARVTCPTAPNILALARHAVSEGRPAGCRISRTRRGD